MLRRDLAKVLFIFTRIKSLYWISWSMYWMFILTSMQYECVRVCEKERGERKIDGKRESWKRKSLKKKRRKRITIGKSFRKHFLETCDNKRLASASRCFLLSGQTTSGLVSSRQHPEQNLPDGRRTAPYSRMMYISGGPGNPIVWVSVFVSGTNWQPSNSIPGPARIFTASSANLTKVSRICLHWFMCYTISET